MCDVEQAGSLPFLDVHLSRGRNSKLHSQVYRKPTHTDNVLDYRSGHPTCHKRGCVCSLVDRAKTHCSDREQCRMEILHVTHLLRENHYPHSFIESCCRKPNYNSNTLTTPTLTEALPYIQHASETTSRILCEYNVNITPKPQSSLRAQLSKPKDHVNK